ELATRPVALVAAVLIVCGTGCSLNARPIGHEQLEHDAGDVVTDTGHSDELEHIVLGGAGAGGMVLLHDAGSVLVAVPDRHVSERSEDDAGAVNSNGDDAGEQLEHDAGVERDAGSPPPATHQCTARCIGGQYHCPNAGGSFSCVNTPCTCSGAKPPDTAP